MVLFLLLLLLLSSTQSLNIFYNNSLLRYVPIKDLLGIYEKLYGRNVINKNVIVDCTHLQFLEM
jgi:hypothetical protein